MGHARARQGSTAAVTAQRSMLRMNWPNGLRGAQGQRQLSAPDMGGGLQTRGARVGLGLCQGGGCGCYIPA